MCRRISLLLAAGLLSYGVHAEAASIYKCKHPQGELVYQDMPCTPGSRTVSTRQADETPVPEPVEPARISNGTLIVRQHSNGHYFVEGAVNGKALTFVIDTGASVVALPRSFANRAQLYCQGPVLTQTARGTASACRTVIPLLIFGPFQLRNVTAAIFPDLPQALLGMSVLQLFRLEQENGELRISLRK